MVGHCCCSWRADPFAQKEVREADLITICTSSLINAPYAPNFPIYRIVWIFISSYICYSGCRRLKKLIDLNRKRDKEMKCLASGITEGIRVDFWIIATVFSIKSVASYSLICSDLSAFVSLICSRCPAQSVTHISAAFLLYFEQFITPET